MKSGERLEKLPAFTQEVLKARRLSGLPAGQVIAASEWSSSLGKLIEKQVQRFGGGRSTPRLLLMRAALAAAGNNNRASAAMNKAAFISPFFSIIWRSFTLSIGKAEQSQPIFYKSNTFVKGKINDF
jgi:hypothetical protein